jgi:endonuclease YncB( thermonuclease family)
VPPSPNPAAPPPMIATEVIGRAHFAQHTLAILDVDGTPVRLQGVLSQGDRQREAAERFLSYITQGTNQVRCEPEGNKTYECRAVRTDVRIGAGMIANGFAGADPAAPVEFQHWEDDARRAHRGIWGAQANR